MAWSLHAQCWKMAEVNTVRLLKYVWPFFNMKGLNKLKAVKFYLHFVRPVWGKIYLYLIFKIQFLLELFLVLMANSQYITKTTWKIHYQESISCAARQCDSLNFSRENIYTFNYIDDSTQVHICIMLIRRPIDHSFNVIHTHLIKLCQ